MLKKVKCVRIRYFQSMLYDFSLTSPPKSYSSLLHLTLVCLSLLQREALRSFHCTLNNVHSLPVVSKPIYNFFFFLLLDLRAPEGIASTHCLLASWFLSNQLSSLLRYNSLALLRESRKTPFCILAMASFPLQIIYYMDLFSFLHLFLKQLWKDFFGCWEKTLSTSF